MELGFTTIDKVVAVDSDDPPKMTVAQIHRLLDYELKQAGCIRTRAYSRWPSPPEYIFPQVKFLAVGEIPVTDGPAYDHSALFTEDLRWIGEHMQIAERML